MKLLLIIALIVNISYAKSYTIKMTREVHGRGLKAKKLNLPKHSMRESAVVLPDSFDLRYKGLSPVMNQGQCGSCYAHAPAYAVRNQLRLQGKDPGELSAQYLMDYSGYGCEGGYFDTADQMVNPKIDPLAVNYPYQMHNQSKKTVVGVGASISSWAAIGDGEVTPKDLETYIVQNNAPIAITIYAGGDFDYYSGGIFDECLSGSPNHMVTLVGYANEGQTFSAGGYLAPGKGYWIIANSWGSSWGENGFLRMRMTNLQGQKCSNVAFEGAAFFLSR